MTNRGSSAATEMSGKGAAARIEEFVVAAMEISSAKVTLPDTYELKTHLTYRKDASGPEVYCGSEQRFGAP